MMSSIKPLQEMSVGEKLEMMEILWNELCQNDEDIESPAWRSSPQPDQVAWTGVASRDHPWVEPELALKDHS